jgi:hypothetical protein
MFHDRMRLSMLEANRKHLVGLEDVFVAEHPSVPVEHIPAPKTAKGVPLFDLHDQNLSPNCSFVNLNSWLLLLFFV